ncbi:hypothetical protein K4L44_09055 [Halosquirtibacter laminarini]|uniref:Uncharacterized protein n=1 Tax=Halosquirtibacter laminarini TaxID=3374600 RepID=A0AC61NL08_9BACT|nr:hypothetical protein K4L44_09055 [Prolixibacteraceae bacterium]
MVHIQKVIRQLSIGVIIFASFAFVSPANAQESSLKTLHDKVLQDARIYPKVEIDFNSTVKLIAKDGSLEDRKSDASTLRRYLLPMVQYWYSHSSDVSSKEKRRIISAVDYWCQNHIISTNWTKRAFEEPRMASVLGLLLEDIDGEKYASLVQNMATIAEGSFGSRINVDTYQGANVGYRLDGMLGYVALSRDTVAMRHVYEQVHFTSSYHNQGLGLQSDNSWWQHNGGSGQDYWIGYGTSWLHDVLNYGKRTQGTKWELTPKALCTIQNAILDGLSSHYYRNFSDYHVLGRHTTKKGSSNQPRHLIQYIKRLQSIGGDNLNRNQELSALVEQIKNDRYPYRANYFYDSSLMVYREDRYFTSLKMRSARTTGPESGNGNGMKNYHFGDGSFFVVKSGDEYNKVKVALNYQNLPGTTAEVKSQKDIPLVDWGRNNKSVNKFAGGLVHGYQAIAAFQQDRENAFSNILANKAYFYEKDQILFTGNSIRKKSFSDYNVSTNINQAIWRSDILYRVNGVEGKIKRGESISKVFEVKENSWFIQDGVGYLIEPQDNSPVFVSLEATQKSGDWSLLDKVYKEGDVERCAIFSLSIDNTDQGKYCYTIFPTIVPLDMQAQLTETSLKVVANTDVVQAVYSSHRNQTQAVFYHAGSLTLPSGLILSVDKPVILICQEKENGVEIVAADPLQSQSQVFVTVNREMKTNLFARPSANKGEFVLEVPIEMGDWAGKQSSRFYPYLKQISQATQDLLYTNMLKSDKHWQIEQYKGNYVTVKDGEMEIEDEKGCTIWFKKELHGDIAVEYDVVVISNGGKHDRVSDLNCFWMAQDSRQKDFFNPTPKRVGKFYDYNELELYYVGFGGHDNSRSRFRKYTGNFDRPMPLEYDYRTKPYHIVPNKKSTVRVEVRGHWVRYKKDGILVYEMYDPTPLKHGYFGFRTVNNHMKITRFDVFQLK